MAALKTFIAPRAATLPASRAAVPAPVSLTRNVRVAAAAQLVDGLTKSELKKSKRFQSERVSIVRVSLAFWWALQNVPLRNLYLMIYIHAPLTRYL
jgi:hypothetical protein